MPSGSLEEAVSQKEMKLILQKKIAEFKAEADERELHIFNQRIISDDPKTLSEIGKQYGISRERVRQIQKGIIIKLKESFISELPDYAAHV
jgi:RNA polymerase sigma-32 factor